MFLINGEIMEGELGMTLFRLEECAVPMVRLRNPDWGLYLIPFYQIKYIRPLEGFEE